jgi:NAD(P)-dependent dehydrogenase (short-subunit alcohol dehydrogenase family)
MSVAILLGAGRGFALEAARSLATSGYDIVITDVDPGHLRQGQASLEASGLSSRGFVVDARDREAMTEFAGKVVQGNRGVDVLVCVVGGSLGTPRWVDQVSEADSQAVIELCVGSALNALAVFRDGLVRARGSVVFVSSGAARIGDRLGWSPVYAFGKGAMLGMARYIACDPEWGGVRSTAICPGDVATERTEEIHTSGIFTAEEADIVRKVRNTLGRMATPAEIGQAIAQLATGTFASGAILDINGGEYPTPA